MREGIFTSTLCKDRGVVRGIIGATPIFREKQIYKRLRIYKVWVVIIESYFIKQFIIDTQPASKMSRSAHFRPSKYFVGYTNRQFLSNVLPMQGENLTSLCVMEEAYSNDELVLWASSKGKINHVDLLYVQQQREYIIYTQCQETSQHTQCISIYITRKYLLVFGKVIILQIF